VTIGTSPSSRKAAGVLLVGVEAADGPDLDGEPPEDGLLGRSPAARLGQRRIEPEEAPLRAQGGDALTTNGVELLENLRRGLAAWSRRRTVDRLPGRRVALP